MPYAVTNYQGFGIPASQLPNAPWEYTLGGGPSGKPIEGFVPGFDISGKPLPGTGTTAGTLMGAPGQAGAGSQGGVPSVPSPQTTQAQTVAGNIGLGQDLSALAQQITGANAAGAVTPFNLNLPQYAPNWAQAAMNTGQLLQGQLPSADVQALANSVIAQRGLIGGLPADSPAVRSALARTVLGSEYAAQQQGLQNQLSMMAATPTGPSFDASSMLVTPAQQQEWQYLANVLAQSPNPDAAAWANLASLGAGMGSGYGRGPTTGQQDPMQAQIERYSREQEAAAQRDSAERIARIMAGAGQTTAPTVAPSYGGLSAADIDFSYSLGYDPWTGAEVWPSDYYGGAGTTNYLDYYGDAYTPEESQYWPGPY